MREKNSQKCFSIIIRRYFSCFPRPLDFRIFLFSIWKSPLNFYFVRRKCVSAIVSIQCFSSGMELTGSEGHANIFVTLFCFVHSSSIMNMFKLVDLCSQSKKIPSNIYKIKAFYTPNEYANSFKNVVSASAMNSVHFTISFVKNQSLGETGKSTHLLIKKGGFQIKFIKDRTFWEQLLKISSVRYSLFVDFLLKPQNWKSFFQSINNHDLKSFLKWW